MLPHHNIDAIFNGCCISGWQICGHGWEGSTDHCLECRGSEASTGFHTTLRRSHRSSFPVWYEPAVLHLQRPHHQDVESERAYVETPFGHQDEVVDVAALAQERCISVGARDRTAQLWKVLNETQLVFRGGGGEKKSRNGTAAAAMESSMDCIAIIDEELFVTGSDGGSLSL
jgi:hypothetical protein